MCLCRTGTWLALVSSSFTFLRPLSTACLASSTLFLISTCSFFRVLLNSSSNSTVSRDTRSSCSSFWLKSMTSSICPSRELRMYSTSLRKLWMSFRFPEMLGFWAARLWWAMKQPPSGLCLEWLFHRPTYDTQKHVSRMLQPLWKWTMVLLW